MSAYGSKDIGFLLVDGMDILINTLGLTPGGVEPILDKVTPLGNAFPRFKDTGQRTNAGLTLDVLYDDTALNTATLADDSGTSRMIIWCVTGNAVGKRFEAHPALLTGKVKRLISDGKLHRGSIPYEGSDIIEEGTILHPHQQETTNGNTQATSHDWTTESAAIHGDLTSQSAANPTIVLCTGPHGLTGGEKVKIAGSSKSAVNGVFTATVIDATHFSVPVDLTSGAGAGGTFVQASTPGGGAGYMACSQLALSGYTNIIGKVRHSADNSTFADLITFTAVTAAPSKERITTATTVNQYLASSWALTGSGATPTFTFMIGFSRAAQNL